jgi:hypothetical protein
MYSVNNPSYIEEANIDVEAGFTALYNDKHYSEDFDKVENVFRNYFKLLKENLRNNNQSLSIIEQIRLKLLQNMQFNKIERLMEKNNELKELRA